VQEGGGRGGGEEEQEEQEQEGRGGEQEVQEEGVVGTSRVFAVQYFRYRICEAETNVTVFWDGILRSMLKIY